MVAVVLIEPQGAPQKLLRVTLPVGVDVNSSVTIAIDETQLLEARHLTWLPIGRVAEVGVGTDFVDRLKKGRLLLVESKSSFGATTSFVMPLTDFATAYNGPPADPKTLDRERWENRKPWKDDTLDPRAFRKSIQ